MMLLDLPWYAVFPLSVIGGMILLILAGFLYGILQARRYPPSDSTETNE